MSAFSALGMQDPTPDQLKMLEREKAYVIEKASSEARMAARAAEDKKSQFDEDVFRAKLDRDSSDTAQFIQGLKNTGNTDSFGQELSTNDFGQQFDQVGDADTRSSQMNSNLGFSDDWDSSDLGQPIQPKGSSADIANPKTGTTSVVTKSIDADGNERTEKIEQSKEAKQAFAQELLRPKEADATNIPFDSVANPNALNPNALMPGNQTDREAKLQRTQSEWEVRRDNPNATFHNAVADVRANRDTEDNSIGAFDEYEDTNSEEYKARMKKLSDYNESNAETFERSGLGQEKEANDLDAYLAEDTDRLDTEAANQQPVGEADPSVKGVTTRSIAARKEESTIGNIEAKAAANGVVLTPEQQSAVDTYRGGLAKQAKEQPGMFDELMGDITSWFDDGGTEEGFFESAGSWMDENPGWSNAIASGVASYIKTGDPYDALGSAVEGGLKGRTAGKAAQTAEDKADLDLREKYSAASIKAYRESGNDIEKLKGLGKQPEISGKPQGYKVVEGKTYGVWNKDGKTYIRVGTQFVQASEKVLNSRDTESMTSNSKAWNDVGSAAVENIRKDIDTQPADGRLVIPDKSLDYSARKGVKKIRKIFPGMDPNDPNIGSSLNDWYQANYKRFTAEPNGFKWDTNVEKYFMQNIIMAKSNGEAIPIDAFEIGNGNKDTNVEETAKAWSKVNTFVNSKGTDKYVTPAQGMKLAWDRYVSEWKPGQDDEAPEVKAARDINIPPFIYFTNQLTFE